MELDERLIEAYNNISEASYYGDDENYEKHKRDLLALDITDGEQLYIIAQHFMQGLSLYEIAKALLQKITKNSEFYSKGCIVLSDVERFGFENYEGAFAILDEAIESGAGVDNILFAKARIYVDLEQNQEALAHLEQINPDKMENYSNILNWYMTVYRKLDNLNKAHETFELAKSKYATDYSYPTVVLSYARFLIAEEKYQEALMILEEVTQLSKDYVDALSEWQNIYRQLDESNKADLYMRWQHILERAWAHDGIINSAIWGSETDLDKLQFWNQISKDSPEYYYAQLQIAFIAFDLNEIEISKEILTTIPEMEKKRIEEEYDYDFQALFQKLDEKLRATARPKTVPKDAFFDKKENIWVLGQKNDRQAYIGEVLEWDIDGRLSEKSIYTGDEGDTVTFEAYNQAFETESSGRWVEGLMVENMVYRCSNSDVLENSYGVEDPAVTKAIGTKFTLLNQTMAIALYNQSGDFIGEEDFSEGSEFPEGFFDTLTRELFRVYSAVHRGVYSLIAKRLAKINREDLQGEELQSLYDAFAFIAAHVEGNNVVIDDDFISGHSQLSNASFKQYNVNFSGFIETQARKYLKEILAK